MAQTTLETRLTAKDETARAFRSLKTSLGSIETAMVNVGKIAAGFTAIFGAAFVADIVKVSSEFQSLKASLVTFTGSVENAEGAFKILDNFAKETPFGLQEIVSSFNILIARGITPTEDSLKSFADIAAGSGKTFIQFAEAVADASVNEFERLKEFGIKAKSEGDKLTLSIGDFTKTVNKDAASIIAALTEIGELKFGGAAARQMDTLGGAFTNLFDELDRFKNAIGESGFAGELTKVVQGITAMIAANEDAAKKISDGLVAALNLVVASVRLVFSNLDTLFDIIDVVFGVAVIKKVIATANSIIKFAQAVARAQITLAIISTVMTATKGNLLLLGAAATVGGIAVAGFNEEIMNGIAALGEKIKFTALLETAEAALGLELFNVTDAIDKFNKETEFTNQSVLSNTKTLSDFIPVLDETTTSTLNTAAATTEYKNALEKSMQILAPFATAMSGLVYEKKVLGDLLATGKITNEEYAMTLNTIARGALGLDTTFADLTKTKTILDQAFATGIIGEGEYISGIQKIKEEMANLAVETDRSFGAGAKAAAVEFFNSVNNNAANMKEFVGGAFASLQTSLSDFFYTGDFSFQNFIDAIKRGLADLAAKAVISVGMNFLGKVFPNLAFAEGGLVPGSGAPKADDVLARVSSGEYVVRASSVSKFGTGFFDALNSGQMPRGMFGGNGGGMSIDAGLMESMTPGFFLGRLIKGIKTLIENVVDMIGNIVRGVIDTIERVVGAVGQAVRGLVDSIVNGNLLSIVGMVAPFILPGVGGIIAQNLAGGQGFIGSIVNGISSSFGQGILGGGSLSSVAQQVGISFAKNIAQDQLAAGIAEHIVGIKGNMAMAGSQYEQDRADRFAILYQQASPYLAAGTGANVRSGDNVRVGEMGPELFIPNRNGSVAPIKGTAGDLIGSVNEMKDEIKSLRRDLARVISGGQLVGARS